MLFEELLESERLLPELADVFLLLPLGGGKRLVNVKVVLVRELPVAKRLRLSGNLGELQLFLFLDSKLIDVCLGFHALELVRVFEIQIGLHERETHQACVLF